MSKYIFLAVILMTFFYISCDDADDLLDQYIQDGPITYAAKVDSLKIQSGYYRLRVNIYPAEDVNRAYCILSWNITEGSKDSVRVDYSENNFDMVLGCYYSLIDIPPSDDIQGNFEIKAQNVDDFGNRSLIDIESAYIYGSNYISSLRNAPVSFSSEIDEVIFEERVGSVGNLLSYEKTDGSFTKEVFVTDESYPLIDPKIEGLVRTKTRFLINGTDIDTLAPVEYLETRIPETP